MSLVGKEANLSHDRLLELLAYDAATGLLTWRVQRGYKAKVGSIAGHIRPNGYWNVSIDEVGYKAHRVAWFYVHKKWPEADLDHINGVRIDNRIENLREATRGLNHANRRMQANNQVGFKGVHTHANGRFCAQIRKDGKRFHIGLFDTPELANAAYAAKAKELFGDFARAK
jgi:hypothetical protein